MVYSNRLSASIPLILTHVQRNFYLVPSLPYFAISCALFIVPLVHYFNKKNLGLN